MNRDASRSPCRACRACGRPIERLGRGAEPPAWCSRACRARRIRPVDRALERLILDAVHTAPANRPLTSSTAVDHVRESGLALDDSLTPVEHARRAARRLANRGRIQLRRSGRPIDAPTAGGTFELHPTRDDPDP